MQVQIKTHSHKRSKSLQEEPTTLRQPEYITFVTDIQSELTMKLLEQSQKKSQFQINVDFLYSEEDKNMSSFNFQDRMRKNEKGQHNRKILKEHFQIQYIGFRKKINKKVQKVFQSGLNLEKLENEAKAYSRLRYHHNKKSKVFNNQDRNTDFQISLLKITWDQKYCSIDRCVKA